MTTGSTNQHIEKAVNRYSSLFYLPSYRRIAVFLFVECVATGCAAFLVFDFSYNSLMSGVMFGLLLYIGTLSVDAIAKQLLLKKDLIFSLRRCLGLSLFSNMILLAFIFPIGLAASILYSSSIWAKIIVFGFFGTLSLRFLVLYSLSSVELKRALSSGLFQPAVFLLLLFVSSSHFTSQKGFDYIFFLSSMAALFALVGVYFFIRALNKIGMEFVGLPSMRIFRAFMANWTEGEREAFEDILEEISEQSDIEVSLLAFRAHKKMKAIIVVPSLHPGPFKNIGSSPIPHMILKALETKLQCVVSVPHGISGHDLDLASQSQNQRVIEGIIEGAAFSSYQSYSSQLVTVEKDGATANCQVFGNCAFLVLTLAPKTMEDLPLRLNTFADEQARERGFDCVVAIDAHNSIKGPFKAEAVIEPLKESLTDALEKAKNLKKAQFSVGSALIVPRGFGIKEGFGPGGISVIAVEVSGQRIAYITIDGNNMVSGLRQKILSSLNTLGFASGEIMTTDTHAVNAVTLTKRGYNPIGEVIEHKQLIDLIKKVASEAVKNLEPVETSWRKIKIQNIKVVGEKQINDLSILVDKVWKGTKKNSLRLFPLVGVILALALFFV